MKVLIYTADSIYKDWIMMPFHDIANKNDVEFDIANLADRAMYSRQLKETNYNLIIFDDDSFNFDFLLRILINCNDSDKNIIYLRTVKYNKKMSDYNMKRIKEVMYRFFNASMWVLQDIVELCNLINKLGSNKKHSIIEQNLSSFVDNENISEYEDFLKEGYSEFYTEGICLLQQSKYIISRLNESNNTK